MKKAILALFLILFIPTLALYPLYAKEKIDNCGLPQVLKRMHFIIYHNDRSAANKISWKAEYCYKKIIRHFNIEGFRPWEKDKKCTIYLFENREDYIKKANMHKWSVGCARYKPPRLYI